MLFWFFCESSSITQYIVLKCNSSDRCISLIFSWKRSVKIFSTFRPEVEMEIPSKPYLTVTPLVSMSCHLSRTRSTCQKCANKHICARLYHPSFNPQPKLNPNTTRYGWKWKNKTFSIRRAVKNELQSFIEFV